jgi:hypothetical protein
MQIRPLFVAAAQIGRLRSDLRILAAAPVMVVSYCVLAGRMSMNIYLTERGKTNGDGSENGGSYFEEGRIKV